MLRLAVIHQLVLSLLIGPMLCCCTAARVGEAKYVSQAPAKKLCCGHFQSQGKGDNQERDGKKPVSPSKCPCKEKGQAYAKDVVVETISTSTAVITPLEFQFLSLIVANISKVGCDLGVNAGEFDTTPDSRHIAARILYAHHNLRC